METYKDALLAIGKELAARAETDKAYKAAKEAWDKVETTRAELRGTVVPVDAKSLIQKYLPKVLGATGLGGAGAGLTALLADDGAFRSILSLIGL